MSEPSNDENKVVPLTVFSDILCCDTSWLANICGRFNIPVNSQGAVDIVVLRHVLMNLMIEPVVPVGLKVQGARGDILRRHLIQRFENAGFELVSRKGKSGMQLCFVAPNHVNFSVFSYVISKSKYKKTGFTVRNTPGLAGNDWFALISEPAGHTYLLSPADMEKRWAETTTKVPHHMSMTFCTRTQKERFVNRISEMVASFSGEEEP
jgi:hypothetical protein